jgi:hypothetical protein
VRLGPPTAVDDATVEAFNAVMRLATGTRRLGERHRPDHDVHQLTTTLAVLLDEAAAALAAHAKSVDAPPPDPERRGGPLAPVREKLGDALGDRPLAGALLLCDLRDHLAAASDASVACMILAQGAQATGHLELLEAVTAAHAMVLRVHRWSLTRLKTRAPQVLTA